MNILIVKLGSIGDIVHTLPALVALRRAFSGARIDWLVEARSREILVGNPYLDAVLEVDTIRWRRRLHRPSTWREIGDSLGRLRSRRYDLVFDFQGLLKSALFSYIARSPRRIGFERTQLREPLSALFTDERVSIPDGRIHVIDKNLYLLRSVGIEAAEHAFPIDIPEELDRRAASALDSMGLSRFVAVNPGGGWPTKRWSAARYGEMAREIRNRWALASLVLWGPGEEVLARQVAEASGGTARVAPPTTLREMIPYLRRAHILVGGDTGPLHIASALGVPVVGVFGPTDPVVNGPFHGNDRVIWKAVGCSPCYKRRCLGYGTVCLSAIEAAEVLDAVADRLRKCQQEEPPVPEG